MSTQKSKHYRFPKYRSTKWLNLLHKNGTFFTFLLSVTNIYITKLELNKCRTTMIIFYKFRYNNF